MNNINLSASSNSAAKQFIESSINTANIVLEHYDFVISDISSNISNPQLERTKGPTIEFLKNMRKQWLDFKYEMESKLQNINKEEK